MIGPLQIRIMHTIWRDKSSSVHEVHEQLTKDKSNPELAYTTVLTVMRNLVRRKILDQHKTSGRSHLFTPLMTEDQYKKAMLEQVCSSFFDGNKEKMIKTLSS